VEEVKVVEESDNNRASWEEEVMSTSRYQLRFEMASLETVLLTQE